MIFCSIKLTHYGIRNDSLGWFESYICETVKGSILGPILFLIYINDSQFAAKTAHLVLYADGMNLLFSHKSLRHMTSNLNQDLSSLMEWFIAYCKSIKTKFIHFGTKQRIKNMVVNMSANCISLQHSLTYKIPRCHNS